MANIYENLLSFNMEKYDCADLLSCWKDCCYMTLKNSK